MGRKADSKCVYCARNYVTEAEAQTKHPECYVAKERLCYYKRYRLRNRSQVNAKRRQNSARAKGIETLEPILPEAYRAELEIYGKENQFVHAIALKIYQGKKLSHQMSPQHTQGLRQPELEDYIQKLLAYLETEYGIDCFGLIYWLNPTDCPECKINY
ncbi:hypothetical protein [Myxosarcina sp. GI1]|uniref:hypothetical protein n=1 Tax=Myxosarcina sp. GI1 TaxID=1541065 RepID=UPI00055D6567|nr:hypothetical protein [Myxosarcina sp. GI1]